jgi:tRNA (guanosine-2'-O-)-methyltransferase
MDAKTRAGLTEYLGQFITEPKKEKIVERLDLRTRHITVVIEDVYQPQNASAVLRTSEIMGLQDIYFIENQNTYKVNKAVVRGAAYWMDLYRFNEEGQDNTAACLKTLRQRGYKLAATTPHKDGLAPWEVPLNEKVAFLFGTEKYGLSDQAIGAADYYVQLPMYGFTQSFNLSVTAAITLSHMVERLRQSDISWELSDEEKKDLTLKWYRRIITDVDKLKKYEKAYFKENPA